VCVHVFVCIHMCVFVCVCVCVCVCERERERENSDFEEGIESLGSGMRNTCAVQCECWVLNSGPLEEQPAALTI